MTRRHGHHDAAQGPPRGSGVSDTRSRPSASRRHPALLAPPCATGATLRYWRHLGTGPRSFRIGRGVRYWHNEVTTWLQAKATAPPPHESWSSHQLERTRQVATSPPSCGSPRASCRRPVDFLEVQGWVSELTSSGLSGSTVRQAHRVFSLLLETAVRSKRLSSNPAIGVKLPRAGKPEKTFLTHEQVTALADAAGESGTVILVLSYCGLRWGEMAALRVGRVDTMRRWFDIAESVTEDVGRLVWGDPKNHQRRSVPIPKFLVDELDALKAGKGPKDLLFTGDRGGVLRNGNFRRDVFDHAARAAGPDGLTPHELRHTAASLAVGAGANVKAVQRMLGHASAAMTLDVYAGLFDDDLDGPADRMDEAHVYSACTQDDERAKGKNSNVSEIRSATTELA